MSSVTQEMGNIIATLAQTRTAQVGNIKIGFRNVKGENKITTLKLVKTTIGHGWVLNDKIMFTEIEQAAKAFFHNMQYFGGTFIYLCMILPNGDTEIIEKFILDSYCIETTIERIEELLKNPPIVVDNN